MDVPSAAHRVQLPSRDVLRVLGDNTRYAIYLELARSPRPLVTAEIAETLGLHPNTVRPHLDRIREVGLLDVTTDARGEVGRPQHRYSLSPDAPSLGLEPPTMPMLARMVLAMARRLGANPADAVAVGEAEGATRAAGYDAAPSALEALVADLDRLGFDPVVTGPTTTTARPRRAGDRRGGVRQLPLRRPRPRPPRPRVRPAPWAGRRVRRPDGRRRGDRVLPAGQPHAMSCGGDHPLTLTEQPPGGTTVITLTETAAVKVKELLAAEGADDLALRVAVRPGGCSGFSYEMFFDGDVAADDEQAPFGPDSSVKVVVDAASAQLLLGATLDYKDGLDQSGFAITNPNATRTCGCGQSFS